MPLCFPGCFFKNVFSALCRLSSLFLPLSSDISLILLFLYGPPYFISLFYSVASSSFSLCLLIFLLAQSVIIFFSLFSGLHHILLSERVVVGKDGNLYFAHLTADDRRNDYTCNVQYLATRTILAKEPITLIVNPCEFCS